MSRAPVLRTSRRGALWGVLAGLAATGCDAGEETPEPAGRTSGEPATGAPEDPDLALVDDVRRELGRASALVAAAIADHPRLAADLSGFRRLHHRHLAALPGDDRTPEPSRVRGGSAAVRSRVLARESALRGRLADAAVAAESGPLAALLASMSAAVAQQLAVPARGASG